MTKYRITDLRNFISACDCRSLTEAAQKLGMTQPSLSESIRRLEHDFQEMLFYRSRTGIKLTSSGKWLQQKALRVLQALDELEDSQDKASVFGGRSIRIGCHATVAQYAMPQALKYIFKHAPDYKISLHHALSRDIQFDVQRGVLDVGLVINATAVPDLVVKKIGEDSVGVFSKGTDFDRETVICNAAMFQTQSILRNWKNKPKRVLETESLELVCRLVEAKIGYGIVPKLAIRLLGMSLHEHTNLPHYKDSLSLVYRPEFRSNEAENIVCEALRKWFTNV